MTTMNLKTIKALETFLEGNQPVTFAVLGCKAQRYDFVHKPWVKFAYMSLPKKRQRHRHSIPDKNDRLYSRQQLTRLIQQYTKTGKIDWTPCGNTGKPVAIMACKKIQQQRYCAVS